MIQHCIQQSTRMFVMRIHIDRMIIHTLLCMHVRNCIVVSITIHCPILTMFISIDVIITVPVNMTSSTSAANRTMLTVMFMMSLISHSMNSATNTRIVKIFATRVIPTRYEKPIISSSCHSMIQWFPSAHHVVLPFPSPRDICQAGCAAVQLAGFLNICLSDSNMFVELPDCGLNTYCQT